MWQRDSASLLGLSPQAFRSLGVVAAALALVIALAAIESLRGLQGGLTGDDAEAAGAVVRVMGHATALTAVIVGTVFALLTGDSSRLETLLRLLGAGTRERLALLIAPMAGVTVAMSLLLVLPLAAFAVSLVDGTGRRAWIVAVMTGLALTGPLLGLTIHQVLTRALRRRLHLPATHAGAAAAAVVVGATVAVCLPAFAPGTSSTGWRAAAPGEAVGALHRWMTLGGDAAAVAVPVLALLVLTALAVFLAGRPSAPLQGTRWGGALTVRPPQSPRGATVWFELVTLCRSPATVLSLLGAVACGAAAVALRSSPIGDLALVAAAAVAGATALRSTGVNLPSAWVLWVPRGKDRWWSASKMLAAAVVALGVFLVVTPLLIVAAGPVAVIGVGLQVLVPVFVGALAAGALAPVSDDQPLSTAVGGAITLLISGGLSVAVAWLLGTVGVESMLLTLIVVALASLGLAMVAHARIRPESVISHS